MAVLKGAGRSVERESHWRGHVEAQAGGGESIRAYCAAYGLSEASFHYWKRELRLRAGERKRAVPTATFAELRVEGAPSEPSALEVHLASGHRVLVRPGFDEATLSRVVRALARAEGR